MPEISQVPDNPPINKSKISAGITVLIFFLIACRICFHFILYCSPIKIVTMEEIINESWPAMLIALSKIIMLIINKKINNTIGAKAIGSVIFLLHIQKAY